MSVRKEMLIGLLLASIAALVAIWFSGGRSDFDEVAFAEAEISAELESEFIDVGAVSLHVVSSGPLDGEPIILLHGFPEYWFVWRKHMAILANAGFRVVAPDLRGYNRSDKPGGRGAYSTRQYASDVLGLMDSLGWRSANFVAHDIGAVITWRMLFENASRVKSAVLFSVPHPLAVDPDSESGGSNWYRTLFRIPILPELLSRTVGLSMTANNMRKTSRPNTFTDEELGAYKEAWKREHAFTTMLGYYRANHEPIASMPDDGRPRMPVMYIYGMQDRVISVGRAEATVQYLGKANVKFYAELSHWLLTEDPTATAKDIMIFVDDANRAARHRNRALTP